ncbi:MAG TPA: TlpA disulfide reductase family protein [Rhodocyclaceae bacterium]|nr:TlpA disulfide reductase family protein [Rhodocyclaceae bacterium]
MNRPSPGQLALLGVLAAAAVGFGYLISRERPSTPRSVLAALPATAAQATTELLKLSLPGIDGKTYALADWRGKILVVNYWATWCPPCLDELPAFSSLQRRYAAQGVQFVGLSIDEAENVRRLLTRTPVAYPLLLGTMATLQTSAGFGNPSLGLPFTVIVDRRGKLHSVKLGRIAAADLENRLQHLLTR